METLIKKTLYHKGIQRYALHVRGAVSPAKYVIQDSAYSRLIYWTGVERET